jgi:hypothetical protein
MRWLRNDIADLQEALARTRLARDTFREHSVTLNRTCWALHELLGDVEPDDTRIEGDADELVARIRTELTAARAEAVALRVQVAHWRQQAAHVDPATVPIGAVSLQDVNETPRGMIRAAARRLLPGTYVVTAEQGMVAE